MHERILWCCHVRGSDDLVPTPDYESAVALADWFTAVDHINSSDDMNPLFSAVPTRWPGDEADHASSLMDREEGRHDYPLKMNLPLGSIRELMDIARKHPLCRLGKAAGSA